MTSIQRSWRRWAAAWLTVWALLPQQNAGAQDKPALPHHTAPVATPVWRQCESSTPLTFLELVTRAAPILWFSPDEPLTEGNLNRAGGTVPEALPLGDAGPHPPGIHPVVYYRIRRLQTRPGVKPKDPELQNLIHAGDNAGPLGVPLDKIESVYIRFLFYYSFDIGGAPHKHDLESLEVEIGLQPTQVTRPTWCQTGIDAVLRTASGSAHGIGWFTNTLDGTLADDVVVPLTVLVEEGKHASTPDRNGDGIYTPGYDVNVQIHDAWGIRDPMRAAVFDGSAYRADMGKRRLPEDRVFPPLDTVLFEPYADRRHEDRESLKNKLADRSYDLRPAPRVSQLCTGTDINEDLQNVPRLIDPDRPTKHEFVDLLEEEDYCQKLKVLRHYPIQLEWLKNKAAGFFPSPRDSAYEQMGQRLSFAWRIENGNKSGFSGVIPVGHEIPGISGWVVAKANFSGCAVSSHSCDTWGIDAVYSPSASRFLDWYFAAGMDTSTSLDGSPERMGAQEVGMRFRIPILALPLRFWGGRVGVRNNSFNGLRNTRLVLEFGGGSW